MCSSNGEECTVSLDSGCDGFGLNTVVIIQQTIKNHISALSFKMVFTGIAVNIVVINLTDFVLAIFLHTSDTQVRAQ